MDSPFVYVDKITLLQNSLPVFQDLSASFAARQMTGLVAPNGAGKSTFFKILSGLLAPNKGRVWLNGINVYQNPKQAKRAIGFCPHHPKLYAHLTLNENFGHLAKLHDLPKKEAWDAIDKIKEELNLTALGQCLFYQLSEGTQQRAGIAASLIHQPLILILDEPTSLCDPDNQEIIFQTLKAYQKLGNTIIFSTQQLEEAHKYCDAIYTIKNLRLVPLILQPQEPVPLQKPSVFSQETRAL